MDGSARSLFEYLDVFYRRKWLLIAPVFAFTAAAVYISTILPSYYRSTTVILVEQQQVPEKYVTPTDATPIEKRLSTINQHILSRTNLEKIVNDFKLFEDDGRGRESALLKPLKAVGLVERRPSTKEEMIDLMRSHIEVNANIGGPRRAGEAFSISFTGKDPYTTMQVTNTLASLFIEENLKMREQNVEGTTEFLVSELDKAKKDLEDQEQALRRFREKNMGSLPEQLETNLRTLDRLQMELQTMTSSIRNTEDRKMLLEGQLGVVAVPQAPAVNPVITELERLKGELAALLSVYKENYPDVIITKKRIKEIEAQLAASRTPEEKEEPAGGAEPPALVHPEVYAELVMVKSQLAAFKQREADIRRQIADLEKRVEETPSNEQKLSDIKRDYDISFENYRSLLEKKLNARLAENLEKWQKGERFRVVDPANMPERPFKPDKKLITLGGAAAGAAAGVGLVFLFEFLNPAFRKPEDFEGVTEVPVLATVPRFVRTPAYRKKAGFRLIRGRGRR